MAQRRGNGSRSKSQSSSGGRSQRKTSGAGSRSRSAATRTSGVGESGGKSRSSGIRTQDFDDRTYGSRKKTAGAPQRGGSDAQKMTRSRSRQEQGGSERDRPFLRGAGDDRLSRGPEVERYLEDEAAPPRGYEGDYQYRGSRRSGGASAPGNRTDEDYGHAFGDERGYRAGYADERGRRGREEREGEFARGNAPLDSRSRAWGTEQFGYGARQAEGRGGGGYYYDEADEERGASHFGRRRSFGREDDYDRRLTTGRAWTERDEALQKPSGRGGRGEAWSIGDEEPEREEDYERRGSSRYGRTADYDEDQSSGRRSSGRTGRTSSLARGQERGGYPSSGRYQAGRYQGGRYEGGSYESGGGGGGRERWSGEDYSDERERGPYSRFGSRGYRTGDWGEQEGDEGTMRYGGSQSSRAGASRRQSRTMSGGNPVPGSRGRGDQSRPYQADEEEDWSGTTGEYGYGEYGAEPRRAWRRSEP